MLGLQAYGTMPGLCDAGDETQGFVHAKQTVCQLNYTLAPKMHPTLRPTLILHMRKLGRRTEGSVQNHKGLRTLKREPDNLKKWKWNFTS